jgi:hypothetical protein
LVVNEVDDLVLLDVTVKECLRLLGEFVNSSFPLLFRRLEVDTRNRDGIVVLGGEVVVDKAGVSRSHRQPRNLV